VLSVDQQEEGEQEEDQEEGRQTVRPDVDTLVVQHEQTPQDARGSIEVDAVAMCDVQVILHESRRLFVFTNEVFLLLGRVSRLIMTCLALALRIASRWTHGGLVDV
jgi:transaldolase